MAEDLHRDELMRQLATATPFGRLSGVEQTVVFDWLEGGGHMTRTGKPLEAPRQAPRIVARTTDGAPIYDAGADHRTHETVTMAGRAS